MRRIPFGFACFLSLVFFAGCESPPSRTYVPAEYSGWRSSHEGLLEYPIPGHMDNFRKIYFSPEASDIREGDKYPEGTVIIKEIYRRNDTERPAQLTVMVKDSTSQLSQGGWLWIVKDPDREAETVIKSEFCFTCHTDANIRNPYGDKNPDAGFRDYVFIPLFSDPISQ